MSILCAIFGHRPFSTVKSKPVGSEYGKLVLGPVDGIDRMHCEIIAECARCEKKFAIVKIHLPGMEIQEMLKKAEDN